MKIKLFWCWFQNFHKFLNFNEISWNRKICWNEFHWISSPRWVYSTCKIQIFTFSTVHFSSKFDKYWIIFELLKIKFIQHKILILGAFSVIFEISQKKPESKQWRVKQNLESNTKLPWKYSLSSNFQPFDRNILVQNFRLFFWN